MRSRIMVEVTEDVGGHSVQLVVRPYLLKQEERDCCQVVQYLRKDVCDTLSTKQVIKKYGQDSRMTLVVDIYVMDSDGDIVDDCIYVEQTGVYSMEMVEELAKKIMGELGIGYVGEFKVWVDDI